MRSIVGELFENQPLEYCHSKTEDVSFSSIYCWSVVEQLFGKVPGVSLFKISIVLKLSDTSESKVRNLEHLIFKQKVIGFYI